MRIGLITPEPGHPLLAAVTSLLTREHVVEVLDPRTDPAPPVAADVYLLKSRTAPALALARHLEGRGAAVVNSASATALCQDRTAMAALARRAGLPFAATRTYESFAAWAAGAAGDASAFPAVVKSRQSRRGDLVARVDGPDQVSDLAAGWAQEPVTVQEFTPNDGWDHKLWAVGDRVFAALRRSELSPQGRGPTRPLPVDELPPGWADLVREVGAVFALDVYGVDVIATGAGSPLIVDVNAFPGIRGQAGAPEALAALALSRARTPRPPAGPGAGVGAGPGRA
ncbi:RimK family alpha-L-glutamate ligase [Streptomyces sp. cmx-4-9]|uniref:ATP-grasp domain-containing protein n=1 Tax=Streptomyces sp. cmx-4-9 TaxID=2790941 RepID=UPI00397FA460